MRLGLTPFGLASRVKSIPVLKNQYLSDGNQLFGAVWRCTETRIKSDSGFALRPVLSRPVREPPRVETWVQIGFCFGRRSHTWGNFDERARHVQAVGRRSVAVRAASSLRRLS